MNINMTYVSCLHICYNLQSKHLIILCTFLLLINLCFSFLWMEILNNSSVLHGFSKNHKTQYRTVVFKSSQTNNVFSSSIYASIFPTICTFLGGDPLSPPRKHSVSPNTNCKINFESNLHILSKTTIKRVIQFVCSF